MPKFTLTMPKFTSQILLLFSTILHILGKLFLKDFTRLKVVSCLGSHGENTAFLFLGQTTMKKPLRRKPSGWRRKASIERSHTRQRFPEPDGWEHVPVTSMRPPVIVEIYDTR